MHALRIDCKRLRYSLEFVRHLLGNDGRTLIKQLRRLQDHLGDLNDAVVARDRLITGAPELREESGVRRYRERQEEIVARLIERFPTVWETFIARENRAVLMRALATL
jgi:CHAD domain-containing protein